MTYQQMIAAGYGIRTDDNNDTGYYHPFQKGAITQAQRDTNAIYFAALMRRWGWTDNAIAGALGNWNSECSLNPHRPETKGYDYFPNAIPSGVYPSGTAYGYGMPHWTGFISKYKKFCDDKGIRCNRTAQSPSSHFVNQMLYHEMECTNDGNPYYRVTWFNNHGYTYKWQDFKRSTDSPQELCRAYYWQYERSGAGDPGNRPQHADYYYQLITGHEPPIPPGPGNIPVWLLFKLKNNNWRG